MARTDFLHIALTIDPPHESTDTPDHAANVLRLLAADLVGLKSWPQHGAVYDHDDQIVGRYWVDDEQR